MMTKCNNKNVYGVLLKRSFQAQTQHAVYTYGTRDEKWILYFLGLTPLARAEKRYSYSTRSRCNMDVKEIPSSVEVIYLRCKGDPTFTRIYCTRDERRSHLQ